ncbi:hypothetical protein ACFFX0_33290 [Citricoccus parietis]|uniref:Uncharacterized protein n=1 Tax=Citricoccus parietis TaxID=592307 RepID=A0ABV5G9Z9_9MICC
MVQIRSGLGLAISIRKRRRKSPRRHCDWRWAIPRTSNGSAVGWASIGSMGTRLSPLPRSGQ